MIFPWAACLALVCIVDLVKGRLQDPTVRINAPLARREDVEAGRRLRSAGLSMGRRLTMTEELRTAILNYHNDLRQNTNEPCTAADMVEMTWDSDLETASQDYSELCIWGHDPDNDANDWGENLAASGQGSYTESVLTDLVQAWYDEYVDVEWYSDNTRVRSYNYTAQGKDPSTECKVYDEGDDCKIGHYTQLVEASSDKLGCGVTQCDSFTDLWPTGGVYLVCKYTESGNLHVDGEQVAPFLVGTTCAACAEDCENSLCQTAADVIRCQDGVGASFSYVTVSGTRYYSCQALLDIGFTCSTLQAQDGGIWCPYTCGECTVPDGVGSEFCSAATGSTSSSMSTSSSAATGTTSSGSSSGGMSTSSSAATGSSTSQMQGTSAMVQDTSSPSTSSATSSSSSMSTSTSSATSITSASSATKTSHSSTSTSSSPQPAADASIDGTLTFGFDGGSAQEFVDDFQSDPNGEVGTALKTSIASVVDGAEASDVNITNVTLIEQRRLEWLLERRLQLQQCKVDYTIRLSSDAVEIAADVAEQLQNASSATALQQSLNVQLASFNVSEISVVADVVLVTTTTTVSPETTLFGDPSGHAHSVACGFLSPALIWLLRGVY